MAEKSFRRMNWAHKCKKFTFKRPPQIDISIKLGPAHDTYGSDGTIIPICKNTGEEMGYCDFSFYPKKKKVSHVAILVYDDYCNMGIGKKMYKALCDFADSNDSVIITGVADDNVASNKLHRRFGFEDYETDESAANYIRKAHAAYKLKTYKVKSKVLKNQNEKVISTPT